MGYHIRQLADYENSRRSNPGRLRGGRGISWKTIERQAARGCSQRISVDRLRIDECP